MDLWKLKAAALFSVVALLIWLWVYRAPGLERPVTTGIAPPKDRE
jgi:hypothetical protein